MATTYVVLPTAPSGYKLAYDRANTPYYTPVVKGTIPPLPVVPAGFTVLQSNADRTVNPNIRIKAAAAAPAAPAIATAIQPAAPTAAAPAVPKAGSATAPTTAAAKAAPAAPALASATTIETPASVPSTSLAAAPLVQSGAGKYLPVVLAAGGLLAGLPILVLAGAGLFVVSSSPAGQ